jgi:hypothetical protein
MEEHLFAVLTADEAEAAVAHHLLDLAARLRTGGGDRHLRGRLADAPRAAGTAATASGGVGADRELREEERDRHGEVGHAAALGGEQYLVLAHIDDAVAQAGVLVGAGRTRLDLVDGKHGQDLEVVRIVRRRRGEVQYRSGRRRRRRSLGEGSSRGKPRPAGGMRGAWRGSRSP